MKERKIKVGDIIIKSFINKNGVNVRRHPFVVAGVDNDFVTAIDQGALFAAFAISDKSSTFSKDLAKNIPLPLRIELTPEDGVKKTSLMQIDTITLFASDVLPVDKQGEVNPEIVSQALKIFDILESKNLAKYNLNNLPDVVTEQEETTLKTIRSKLKTKQHKSKRTLKQ